jgi:hypothetical protein
LRYLPFRAAFVALAVLWLCGFAPLRLCVISVPSPFRFCFDTSPPIASFAARFFRGIPVNLIIFASLTYGQSS